MVETDGLTDSFQKVIVTRTSFLLDPWPEVNSASPRHFFPPHHIFFLNFDTYLLIASIE